MLNGLLEIDRNLRHPAAPIAGEWNDVSAPGSEQKMPYRALGEHYDPAYDAHAGTIGITGVDSPREQLKDIADLIGKAGKRVKAIFSGKPSLS